jgi:UPF0755 protein
MASPYNTYMNTGLPPGPIAMPDIKSRNKTEKNDFIYAFANVC